MGLLGNNIFFNIIGTALHCNVVKIKIRISGVTRVSLWSDSVEFGVTAEWLWLWLTNAYGGEWEDGGGAEENVREDPGQTEPVLAGPVARGVLHESSRHDEEGDQHVRHCQGQQ